MRHLCHEAQLLDLLRPLGDALTGLRNARMVVEGWDQSLRQVVVQYDSAYSMWISSNQAFATDSTCERFDIP
jgi:hypothetical protein